MASMRASAALGAVLVVAGAAPCAAQSDPVADFYRGKTINAYIGVGVGGEYDLQARLIAKYIGRHIPGRPNVVPQNMTGASGLKMLNFLYNQAPRDGTAIGMVQNGFPAAQAIGRPGIQFDANRMRWLGTIAPVVETLAVWHTADVQQHRRCAQEGDRRRRDRARRHHLHLSRADERAARHQIQDRHRLHRRQRDQHRDGARRGPGAQQFLVELEGHQAGVAQGEEDVTSSRRPARKANDLDAPAIEELVKTEADRQLVDLIMSGAALGRPMTTTPDVPEPRLRALRAAFLAVMKDPEFIAETAKLNIEIDPVSGEAMQKIVANVLATPKAVAERAKPLLE